MRISRTLTALAAAGLLAAALSGAAAQAATSPPNVCTPTWKLVSAPAGPSTGEQNMMITGVSVDRADDAWFAASNPGVSWAYHWNGHSTSAATAVPEGSYTDRSSATGEPFDGPWVGPVSFDSPADGWMIGYSSFVLSGSPEYAAHWSGGRWTIVPLAVSPHPSSVSIYTTGLAAVSPTDAWAVGAIGSTVAEPMIEHWDGSQWSFVANPAPSQAPSYLTAITARSATDIWAAGIQNVGTSTQEPFSEHWDGTSWTVIPAAPGAGPSRFTAISADGPGDAWAVGTQLEPGTTNVATSLVEHWNGTSWSVVTGLPDLGASELLSVYAASPTDVWAPVYGADTPRALGTSEFLHFNGSSWATVPVPGPQEYGRKYVYSGIAGTGPGNIWAVGWFGYALAGVRLPLIAHLSCG